MDEINMINEEDLEAVAGGRREWREAHWQDTRHAMGTSFEEHGYLWYRIKSGDTLHDIAYKFHVSMDQIQRWNPKTITNIQNIYAGDTIIVGRLR